MFPTGETHPFFHFLYFTVHVITEMIKTKVRSLQSSVTNVWQCTQEEDLAAHVRAPEGLCPEDFTLQ